MSITLITEDEFGRSTARLLEHEFSVEQISLRQGLERDWKKVEPGLVVVCADRPYFAAFEELSDRVMAAELPLTFAVISDSQLLLGPLIVPGKTACYHCFQKRMLSYTALFWEIPFERVVRKAFDEDWSLKIPGMLPTTPLLAVAQIRRHALLQQSDYGVARQIALTESKTVDFRVQPVHGCGCLRHFQSAVKTTDDTDLVSIVEQFFYDDSLNANDGRTSREFSKNGL